MFRVAATGFCGPVNQTAVAVTGARSLKETLIAAREMFSMVGLLIWSILWSHSGPLCHALSLLSLSWTSMLRLLAVANGPNIFQMLLVLSLSPTRPNPFGHHGLMHHRNIVDFLSLCRLVLCLFILSLASFCFL